MREKQFGKGQVFAQSTYHAQLIQLLNRRLNRGGGGCGLGMSPQATFAKKAAWSQDAYDRLFAEFGNDGELDPAFPDVEDGLPGITLRIEYLAWTVV